MYAGTLFPVFAAVATIASAGLVFVDNKCSVPLYFVSYYNENAPLISGELLPGASPGYTEDQRGPNNTNIANNTIAVDTSPDMPHPLIFSYDQNDDSDLFYSFVQEYSDYPASYGYEVLSSGPPPATSPVVCAPMAPGTGFCAQARNPFQQSGPVFQTRNGDNSDFTFRICASDGNP